MLIKICYQNIVTVMMFFCLNLMNHDWITISFPFLILVSVEKMYQTLKTVV